MRQILQHLRTGELMIEEVPSPGVRPGHLLIRTSRTLISAGTERMLVDFGRASLINKARQQPEKVLQVLQKIKTEGLIPTLDAIQSKLDQPMALGYCHVGRVIAVGAGVEGFQVGDRVASNGEHAEVVCVPRNLCVKIPDSVSDEDATFTVIASIGLQGIRLIQPTLGERVAVFGLGLIGLLTVQMLNANGVRVLGFDFNGKRVEMARQLGAEAYDLSSGLDPVAAAESFSNGQGMDAVLITASTKSNDPVHQAAAMSRKRGRIVLVGVVGLELNRSDFYEKELRFQVSCSYGPGRYDESYEQDGQDYPFGFVRWTENRNMEAVLDLLALGRLKVAEMISMRVPVAEAKRAYDAVADGSGLGLILEFDGCQANDAKAARLPERTIRLPQASSSSGMTATQTPVIGVIGAGNFTLRQVLPAVKPLAARLKWIASAGGASSAFGAKKFGFEQATTDAQKILDDAEVQAIFITTRHNSHASWVLKSLRAGKHVFVEKPLCLQAHELDEIETLYASLQKSGKAPILMVGYNRRFSPFSQMIREELLARTQPLICNFTCNAGALPANHWTQDPNVGGGRILGEACHFIDLLRDYTRSPIVSVQAQSLPDVAGNGDTASMSLRFADGSLGNLHYFANGHKGLSKEYADFYYEGKVIRLDNFKAIQGFGTRKLGKKSFWSQDKGHRQGFAAFIEAVRKGGPSPIPFDELINVQRACFAVLEAINKGGNIALPPKQL